MTIVFWKVGIVACGLFIIVFLTLSLGMRSAMRQYRMFEFVRSLKRTAAPVVVADAPFRVNEHLQLVAYSGKALVPAPQQSNKGMVVFAFGQSNSANHGGERHTGGDHVTNFYDGKYYAGADPLLGASGIAGSPWVRAANLLVEGGVADQVVLHTAGIGSTSIAHWRQGGRLYGMLEARLMAVPKDMPITHFLWHQGESDNPAVNRPGFQQYHQGMTEIIQLTKRHFPNSRFYVATATRTIDAPVSPDLQAVQASLLLIPGVFAGPDTDTIGADYRHDGTHLSGRGLELHALAWVKAVRSSK